jgi:hypothetical protein
MEPITADNKKKRSPPLALINHIGAEAAIQKHCMHSPNNRYHVIRSPAAQIATE